MGDTQFSDIDSYINTLFAPTDPMLEAALEASNGAGLPAIHVSAGQGKLLYLLARIAGARRILEIGTLGGYSSIWLARALPSDGRLISLEVDSHHADVARANLERAGFGERAEIVVGAALESLKRMAAAGETPFDLVFIDADKQTYPHYLEWALRLTRPGGLILADNVIRGGEVLDATSEDAGLRGIRAFNAALAEDPRLEAIVLQQVGVKGHDGLAIARVREA